MRTKHQVCINDAREVGQNACHRLWPAAIQSIGKSYFGPLI
jgi:hypothetical protein